MQPSQAGAQPEPEMEWPNEMALHFDLLSRTCVTLYGICGCRGMWNGQLFDPRRLRWDDDDDDTFRSSSSWDWSDASLAVRQSDNQEEARTTQQQQLEVEVQKKDPRPEIETLSRGVNNIVSGRPRRVVREKAITQSLEMDACCSSLSVLPVGKPPHDMSTTRSHIFSILTQHAKSIIR